MRIDLTNGAWAELRDPETLKNRDRRALMLAVDGVEGDIARGLAMTDALTAQLVTDWSLDLPLPSLDRNSIEELSPGDATLLMEGMEEARQALFPDFDDNPLDPKAQEAS